MPLERLMDMPRFVPRSGQRTRSLSSQTSQLRVPRGAPLVSGVLVATGLALYFFYPDESRSAPTFHDTPLSPTHFTPVTLVATEVCNHDTKLMKLQVPQNLIPSLDNTQSVFRPIWSVFIKDDDIQVERPYTPLEGIDDDGCMMFWIKAYEKGEVGRWLHSKRVGDIVEIRGPLQTWTWQDGEWDEVVMISGGTGITPFYQLFHSVIQHLPLASATRFTLLHSSKSPSDLPTPSILRPLCDYATQHPHRFRIALFVDSADKSEVALNAQSLSIGRIDEKAIKKHTAIDGDKPWWTRAWDAMTWSASAPSRSILFLVCGPEPMIASIAGPYGRNFSQGPVGGILRELGYSSGQVRKL